MRIQFRSILPPGWVLFLFALLYVLADGVMLAAAVFFEHRFSFHMYVPWLSQYVLLLGCGLLGFYRIVAIHPVFQAEYRHWLEASAWSARKPLPAGPVHLVWQDVVVLLLIGTLALRYPHFPPTEFIIVFLFTYLIGAAIVLALLRAWVLPYAVAFGMGGVVLVPHKPLAVCAIFLVLYVIAWIELRRTLRDFPWNLGRWEAFLRSGSMKNQQRQRLLGWPFQSLSPEKTAPSMPLHHALLISLLAGWWVRVHFLVDSVPDDAEMPYWMVLVIGSFCRVVIYCSGYLPPLNLAGRVFRMRWIIPGYDKIFLAPAIVLSVGYILPRVLLRNGWEASAVYPLGMVIILLLLFLLGPNLRAWRLTGSHRIYPLMPKQEFVRI
jgi:hypothetical protein